MRVLVCVKRVPAPGARIVLNEDRRSIDTALLGFAVSPHEECAVEEGVRIVEQHGGSVTVLTLGPPEAEEQIRAAFAVGVHAGARIEAGPEDPDPVATARAIASAVQGLEGAAGPFDLILFGNESADSGGYQVGIRVAHALGRPIVSGIKAIEIDDGAMTVQRPTPQGAEVYELPLPAAVAVREGINLPRYPTLKTRLSAKKTPIELVTTDAAEGGQRMIELVPPPEDTSSVQILGDGPEAAAAVVDVVEQLVSL
ncbi:MAG: electron transfer flavoprotein subunit beta/FixA family protein [Acidimicrobiia bacterium]|nr:electron transfer flavoprotein subunit beta/FixA family protein [Acidimicrobiia bacterium]